MARQHEEFWTNEHHGHMNQLPADGDLVIPHCHDAPHLFMPVWPHRLRADTANGIEEQVLDVLEPREIQGGVEHRFENAAPALVWDADTVRQHAEWVARLLNRISGLSFCLFARYGKDGFRLDPKRWTGNPVRY
jgi:hypothetical protein